MTVFSRALVKVSRWELPTSHNNRRAFSSPSLSPETNHELACDSGQDRSASHSLKDVAAPYGLFDQETEQSDFATQLSVGKLGATRALNEQSGSNCESSNVPAPRGTSPAMPSSSTLGATVSTDTQQIETICKSTNVPAPSGPTNVLAPASSSPGATLSCLNVGNHNEQLGSYCKSTNVPAPSGPTNVLAPASSSPGATLSCLNVGNHNEQLGSYCKSTNVPAPSGPTNVLAPASSSPGATLSCLNVGNHNEQLGSLCKSTYVPAPSGPAFTLSASSTSSGATLSCLNVGTHNERIGSFRESDDLAQRVQRAPSPIKRAAENGNPNPISSQSSQTKTARATNNTLILSGKSASPTENLDLKGATNYTIMSGKSASSAVKSITGGTAASSTAKSVLTVHGGTAASSSLTQSHDSNSAVTVTVTGGIKTASSTLTLSHDSNSNDDVTGGMTTASSTRSHDSNSTFTVTGGITTAKSFQSPVSTVVSGFPTSSGPDRGAPDNENDDSNSIDTQSRTNVKSSNCICKCHCDASTSSNTSDANLNISVKLNRSGTSACSKSLRLGQASIRFFTHVMVYYLMLLIHSFNFDSSTLLKSKMQMSMCTTGLYEVSPDLSIKVNTTMKGSPSNSAINMTLNSTEVTMSFITHVVVYYLIIFVYTFVKKAKESCVMFVRYLLDLNKTESTSSNQSSKVLSSCNFCYRDMTYSEILNQLEPPVYCTVSSQYTACDCKNSTATVELEPCDNFSKPCPNAWFDFRSHEKNKSLFEYFSESAMREMLFDTEITVATAMELFDIPLPVSGSLLDVELLLHQLQDEYHFTLKCADCGDVLSTPIICGGGPESDTIPIRKKKRPALGRKRKGKRKVKIQNDPEDITNTISSTKSNDISNEFRTHILDEKETAEEKVVPTSNSKDPDRNEPELDVAVKTNSHLDDSAASSAVDSNDETISILSKIKLYLKGFVSKNESNSNDETDAGLDDEINSSSSLNPDVEVEVVGVTKSKQAKYNATNKGKATKRKYNSGKKGKRHKAKHDKAYSKSIGGKAVKTKANKTYFNKDKGKAARNNANKTYFGTNKGAAARSRTNKTYFGSGKGKAAKKAADRAYDHTMKRRASRKRNVVNKKKYMGSYMPF